MLSRREHEREMELKLLNLEKEVEELKKELTAVELELSAEQHKMLQKMQDLKDKTNKKVHDLLNASDEAWEEMQKGLEHYWKAVGNEMKSYDRFFRK